MDRAVIMLLLINCAVAAVLLQAGLFKVGFPGPLRQALAEILPRHGRLVTDRAVRVIAAAEILTAVTLVGQPTRVPAGIAAGVLGVMFVSAGVAGRARSGSMPCGCLAGGGRHPLGLTSVLFGVSIAAVSVVNILAATLPQPLTGYAAGAPVTAALFTLLTCLWVNRAVIVRLLGPGRSAAKKGVA